MQTQQPGVALTTQPEAAQTRTNPPRRTSRWWNRTHRRDPQARGFVCVHAQHILLQPGHRAGRAGTSCTKGGSRSGRSELRCRPAYPHRLEHTRARPCSRGFLPAGGQQAWNKRAEKKVVQTGGRSRARRELALGRQRTWPALPQPNGASGRGGCATATAGHECRSLARGALPHHPC